MLLHISHFAGMSVQKISFSQDTGVKSDNENGESLLPQDLLMQIFNHLGIIELRRCFLVSRYWKKASSLDILWAPHVKKHIDLSCDFPRLHCIQQKSKYYPSTDFINALKVCVEPTTHEMHRLAKRKSLSTFIGEQKTLIQNPEHLLSIFKNWLQQLPPSCSGIFRCDFLTGKNFFFELFFSHGKKNLYGYHVLQADLDPAGQYMDKGQASVSFKWDLPTLHKTLDPQMLELTIHYNMPTKGWPLKGIEDKFTALFEQYVARCNQ